MTLARLNSTTAIIAGNAWTIKQAFLDAGAAEEEASATALLMVGFLMKKRCSHIHPQAGDESGFSRWHQSTGSGHWHTHLARLAGPWSQQLSAIFSYISSGGVPPDRLKIMVEALARLDENLCTYLLHAAEDLAAIEHQSLRSVIHLPSLGHSHSLSPDVSQYPEAPGTTEGLACALLLAGIAEHLLDPDARKQSGAFYTPLPVALMVALKTFRPLIDNPDYKKTLLNGDGNTPIQILDPSVGSGLFLIASIMVFEAGFPANATTPVTAALNGVDLTPLAHGAAHAALQFAIGSGSPPEKPDFSPSQTTTPQTPPISQAHHRATLTARPTRFTFTIKQGNSLHGIPYLLGSTPSRRPSRAVQKAMGVILGEPGSTGNPFHWNEEFAQTMTDHAHGEQNSESPNGSTSGFHLIVGNPPYGKFPTSTQTLSQTASTRFPNAAPPACTAAAALSPLPPKWVSSHFWREITSLIGPLEADVLANSMRTNTFVAFVLRAIQLAASGGRIGLVLPRSLARVDGYAPLRRAVSAICHVEEIIDLGIATRKVGYEQIALILEKRTPSADSVTIVSHWSLDTAPDINININNDNRPTSGCKSAPQPEDNKREDSYHEPDAAQSVTMPQQVAFGSHPVPFSQSADSMLFQARLADPSAYRPLVEIADIFRGFSYSVNDPGFSLLGPAEESATTHSTQSPTFSAPQWIRVLRGCDVGRYRAGTGAWYNEAQSPRPQSQLPLWCQRMAEEKLVFPNIVSSLVRCNGAYQANGFYNLDTVTNLVLAPATASKLHSPKRTLLMLALLAILNSRLGTYIFRNWIFAGSKLTCHLDRPYLGRFPIPHTLLTDDKTLRLLARQATTLQEATVAYLQPTVTKTADAIAAHIRKCEAADAVIDKTAFALYNLSSIEKRLVETIPPFPYHTRFNG